jgi:hypothetical protein
VWRSPIFEREDVLAGVVVRTEERPLFILMLTPLSKCRRSYSIYCNGLIRIPRLAAGLVSRMAGDHYSVVVHRDLANVQVDVVPSRPQICRRRMPVVSLDMSATALDHVIWRFQRGGSRRPGYSAGRMPSTSHLSFHVEIRATGYWRRS